MSRDPCSASFVIRRYSLVAHVMNREQEHHEKFVVVKTKFDSCRERTISST